MKSKINNDKTAKLTKTAKVALPFFALFGGQGFASSRNPLSLQSSRKMAGKSVVYINEVDAPAIPAISTKINQQAKSPFGVFTNKAVAQTKNANIKIQLKALKFLNDNNLLTSENTANSSLSGNTLSRKSFSDDWQWSTRLSNSAPFTADSFAISTCQASATFNGTSMGFFQGQYEFDTYQSYTCFVVNGAGTAANYYVYNNTAANILATCQAIHQACDGQALPVELMKFEVK